MNPSLRTDFLLWLALITFFCAYTRNMQETTLALGRILVNASDGTGVQDAITPKWQTRNNILMLVGLGLYAVVCLYAFTWYLGILVFLATFFVVIPVTSRLLVPRPMSGHYLRLIHRDLQKRHSSFVSAGDQVRAQAVQELLDRFPQNKARAQQP